VPSRLFAFDLEKQTQIAILEDLTTFENPDYFILTGFDLMFKRYRERA